MQNNKKYWLRGGVISSIIIILTYSIPQSIKCSNLIVFNPFAFGGQGCGERLFPLDIEVIGFLLIVFIIFAIPGIFFGWIYGKIKNRNKV